MALLAATLGFGAAPAQAQGGFWNWISGSGVQGSGKAATEKRAVGEFNAIVSSGSMKLVVRQGEGVALAVTADDNLLPLLETVVEPGNDGPTLHLRWKKGSSVNTRTEVKVVADVKTLSAIQLSGSGDVVVESLKAPALKMQVAGSGDARLNKLALGELVVDIAGSGDVRAEGSATALKVKVAGSGNVRMNELAADDVRVSISGSGDAEVQAQKALNVAIAGSGDVRYSGNATQVKSSVAGSGSVSKKP